MRRAFTWLERSEKAQSDDEKFIFLWIALNAAHGGELIGMDAKNPADSLKFKNFLSGIVKRDEEKKIEAILLNKHPEAIRTLLESPHLFIPFRQRGREEPEGADWREQFEADNQRARKALENRDAGAASMQILRRLHGLRNQMLHTGVTFAEGWARTLLRDGARIMADLVPVVLEIMKAEIDANPASQVWGRADRPRAEDNGFETA